MNVASLDTWAKKAQALDLLATTGDITRRQRRELDIAIMNLDQMLRKRSGKIIRQKYMTDMEDDCSQVCQMGILSAVRSFDPTRSSFSTHVHNQIRAAVGDLKHKMKPESRNVQTLLPVKHVSFSTPISDIYEDRTLGDTIADEKATALIDETLELSMIYQQIDRAYSHYLARVECREAEKLSNPVFLREHRLNKLREREVFVRYYLQDETLDVIASSYKITRERVRQIAAKIYNDPLSKKEKSKSKKPQEPGVLNKYLALSHVSEECPTGFHSVWDDYVALAWFETGKDIRLSPTSLDLTKVSEETYSLAFYPADAIGILPEPAEDAVEVVIEDISDAPHPKFVQTELPLFSVHKNEQKPSVMRRFSRVAAGMAITGSMITAAAAQTSKAIPPEEIEVSTSSVQKMEPRSRGKVQAVRKRTTKTNFSVVDLARVKLPRQAYGVMVASYSAKGDLHGNWPAVRSGWNMLKGLHPAGVAIKGGKYGLVFGPISQDQAQGLCHEAKRKPRECVVTKFGTVTPQKNDANKKARTKQA